jgi:hypothetical protein
MLDAQPCRHCEEIESVQFKSFFAGCTIGFFGAMFVAFLLIASIASM